MATIGVPALLSRATPVANTVALLQADAALVLRMLNRPKWGVYQNGRVVITADNVSAFAYKQETRVSQYPMENGAFASYNKVGAPYDVRIRLTRGGTVFDRQAFLAALEQITASTELYDIVTPERTYTNANVERFDYDRRAENGVGLITADLMITEIRQITDNRKYANSKAPSGAAPVNVGPVQSQDASQAQTDALRSSGGPR